MRILCKVRIHLGIPNFIADTDNAFLIIAICIECIANGKCLIPHRMQLILNSILINVVSMPLLKLNGFSAYSIRCEMYCMLNDNTSFQKTYIYNSVFFVIKHYYIDYVFVAKC